MNSPLRGWHLDATHSSDEILVLLARRGSLAARNELLTRNRERMAGSIALLCRRWSLSPEDREDLEQQIVFWTIEAVTAFDAEELRKPDGCSFRTFLGKVVNRRVANFAQAKRRRRKRFPASVDEQAVGKMGGGDGWAIRSPRQSTSAGNAIPLNLQRKLS